MVTFPVFIECITQFINENFISILDQKNNFYQQSIKNWQELQQNVFRKISNFKSNQQLIKEFQKIIKGPVIDVHKNKNKFSSKNILNEQKLEFRDRKVSMDEVRSKKQLLERKQERSNSFHTIQNNMKSSQVKFQLPQVTSPDQKHTNEKPKNVQQREILSFKSISDYHKSKNTLSMIQQSQSHNNTSELNTISKRSIQEMNATNSKLSSKHPSNNYIQSIKKINIDSRTPNKSTTKYLDFDNEVYERIKTEQNQPIHSSLHHLSEEQPPIINNNALKLRSKTSQPPGGPSGLQKMQFATSSLISPPPLNDSSSMSFNKFLNSFKKLCTTFESNHNKLLREEFTNKYINC